MFSRADDNIIPLEYLQLNKEILLKYYDGKLETFILICINRG